MPLIHSVNEERCSAGVWQIEESESYFLKDLHLYEEEKQELKSLSDRKRIQWLASRHLLHILTNEEKRLVTSKDNFGKPFLIDSPLHISLSHSEDVVAAIIGKFPIGIDIQMKVEKLYRIKNRFLSERELSEIKNIDDLELLHIYWGAKECLFKAYGRGQVDFKKQLYITPIDNRQDFLGSIDKVDCQKQFNLKSIRIGEFIMVYIIDEKLGLT